MLNTCTLSSQGARNSQALAVS